MRIVKFASWCWCVFTWFFFYLSCRERNNEWALEQAKANVLRWYPIVGVLDLMDETLNSLERAFPYFFEGASLIYDKLRELLWNVVLYIEHSLIILIVKNENVRICLITVFIEKICCTLFIDEKIRVVTLHFFKMKYIAVEKRVYKFSFK